MINTHEEFESIWQDDDMLEYGSETKYISSPRSYPNSNPNERTLAQFDKGEWKIEAQIRIDGDWYVARRETLQNPPKDESEWRWNGEVKSNYGAFTNLPTIYRLFLAPIYGIWFMWMCLKGEDVNLQKIDTE